ncbi:membrane protein YpdK [Enterobacter sp. R1(2018)]|uniref:membrane protein YpdK n=1 Tax=Enterobacter sp. R1(2018) TaxID=2447891 RepID=UPI001C7D58E7
MKLIPNFPAGGSTFLYCVIWRLKCVHAYGACEVKYFLMGISVILVVWVGTFVMMVE